MRFDTPIYFQRITSEYNADTGNYEDIVAEDMLRARVTDSGADTLKLVYSELKQGSKTVLLQRPYLHPFDRIRIGEEIYSVDFSRKKKVFVVSEVQ